MTIHLYAEHLVNIRTLSLQASLSTVSNKETRAKLSADGSTLTLSHEGDVGTIKLPINVPGGHSDATLTIPAAPTKDLSFRVSLSEKSCAEGLLTNGVHEDTNVVPWTATSLTSDAQIACKSCSSIIVQRGQVKVWKDLPSENWAEMMDFWHCHRPDVPHDHDHDHAVPLKGYSADSRLALEPGVAMVDPVDFVLAAEDCQNLESTPSSPSPSGDETLRCSSCQASIGQFHSSSGGYKLRKMCLALSESQEMSPTAHSPEEWLACHLLSSIESQGVRKFSIQSTHQDNTALKVWIFTPDINVSSSAARSPEPIRAVKILWLDSVMSDQTSSALTRQTLSEGELELPPDEMQLLRDALVKSAELLPESGKKFQSWNVALLPRFKGTETEPGRQDLASPPVTLPEVPDVMNKEILSPLTS